MKRIEIAILLLIFLLIPLFVFWRNIFPIFSYHIKQNFEEINIKKMEIGSKTFLFNPYYKKQPFSDVGLKIQVDEEFISKVEEPLIISIFENYEAASYPVSGEINSSGELREYIFYDNESDLPNGTVFSNGESAFFVSRGQYLPILSGEIFEKFGFNWDNIIPQETSIFSELRGEGEKIVYNSAHPDGVILKMDNEYYLIWDYSLLKLKNEEIIKEAWEDYYVVEANNLIEIDSCEATIKVKKKKVVCDFDVSSYPLDPNQPYIFKFNQGGLSPHIVDAHSFLKVSAKIKDAQKAFLIFLSTTKEELVLRYGGYLF